MVINTETAVNMNGEMIPKGTVQVNLNTSFKLVQQKVPNSSPFFSKHCYLASKSKRRIIEKGGIFAWMKYSDVI